MKSILVLLERVVGVLSALATALAALLMLAITGIVGYGVAMRYLFNQPQVWSDELASYLIVLVVMLAIAEVLRRGEHISIDLLVERLGTRVRYWVDVAGMVSVIVVAGVLIVSGWDMTAFSADMGIRSTGYLAMPMWLPQATLPLGFALLGLAALNRLLRLLTGLEAPRETGGHKS
ncbi:TRAP transporter small permease [Oceanibaculum indicum]|uniref:TRAP transporter small permease protein n=1 Tax=Oceanibaculum indicum TaxID=526216 RepID=A0A420WBL3_9PROT|nr:TRAP transporter small permease [Oceanibaculum indicum]RKQ68391.1 C4-dicarboxylate transporter DctQ subunit [Oceanibaculum indicum]